MNLKQKIYFRCLDLVNEKIIEMQNSLIELGEGAKNDSKSSAGDKHETARAMMQIEQEKIGKQLNEALEQKNVLKKINALVVSNKITKGSLVKTNKGVLFISAALGKVVIDDITIIALSPQSPLGMKLMGLKINDSTEINGVKYSIESIK